MKKDTTKKDLDAALVLIRRLVYIDTKQDVDTQMFVAAEDAREFLTRMDARTK